MSDTRILEATKGLTAADLKTAFENAAAHLDKFERDISQNEKGEGGEMAKRRMLLNANEDFPFPVVE